MLFIDAGPASSVRTRRSSECGSKRPCAATRLTRADQRHTSSSGGRRIDRLPNDDGLRRAVWTDKPTFWTLHNIGTGICTYQLGDATDALGEKRLAVTTSGSRRASHHEMIEHVLLVAVENVARGRRRIPGIDMSPGPISVKRTYRCARFRGGRGRTGRDECSLMRAPESYDFAVHGGDAFGDARPVEALRVRYAGGGVGQRKPSAQRIADPARDRRCVGARED